jgi:DNA-binding transcriptional LysR family regulator
MDRIDAMQAFVLVADLKGFAPAARKLGLSASGVTRLIAALEDRVGARLLQRTTRSVTLTDVGTRYLERARRIVADVEEAEISAQAERTQPSGRLVVSAPNGFGRLHVTPLISTYLKRYPEVSGELRLSDRVVNLVEDGVDCAVRIGHLADSSLVARNVGDMRRIVVASPDYLARRGEPKSPAAITSHETIQFGATTAVPEWRFVENGRDVRVACTPRFTTNSADAAIWHATQGGGLTRVLAYQAAEAINNGKLKIMLDDFEEAPLPIHLVYPTSRLLSAKVRTFIDLVIEISHWNFSKR